MSRQFIAGDIVRALYNDPGFGFSNSKNPIDPPFKAGDEFTVHGPHYCASDMYLEGRFWSVTRTKFALVKATKPKRDYVADHARRTLRKAGLTKEQARNVVAAMQSEAAKNWPVGSKNAAMRDETTLTVDVSRFSRGIPGHITLAQVIGDSFSWVEAARLLGLPREYFSYLHTTLNNKEKASA